VVQSTYYQETVPRELMGRVFGFQQFFDFVTIPAGIVFGILAYSVYGVEAGIALSGVIIFLFGILGTTARALRNLNPAAEPTSPPQ
jgi:hypothetical protein